MNAQPAPESYAAYAVWKDWGLGEFMAPGHSELAGYDAELGGLALADRPVLEIGFGNGGFLAWAVARGGIVWGSELQHGSDAPLAPNLVALLQRQKRSAA